VERKARVLELHSPLDPFTGAGLDGGLRDDHDAGSRMASDVSRGGLDGRHARVTIGGDGTTDTDEHHLGAGDGLRSGAGEGEPPLPELLVQHPVEVRLVERGAALLEELDDLHVRVDAPDAVPHAGEGHGGHEPDTPGTDHGDLHRLSWLSHAKATTLRRRCPRHTRFTA
jgi:hypothetical protein